MNALASLVLLLFGAYGLLLLFLYFNQGRMLYYPNMPSRELDATPALAGLPYEDVSLTTTDGLQLHAWFIARPREKGVVLFSHGNAGNISHRLDSMKIFYDLGYSVLIFDYRGYGKSEGAPSEQGTYRDAEAAWEYLTGDRGYPDKDIVLFGRSLGGAVTAWLATRHTPRALIVESTFTSVPDMAASLYPLFPVRWLARFRYPAREYLSRIHAPVLIVHSREDEIIPYEHGEKLYAAANPPKEMLTLRGGHNDGFYVSGKTYTEGLRSFLDKYGK